MIKIGEKEGHMRIGEKHYRSIWVEEEDRVMVIDQRLLPFSFEVLELDSLEKAAKAISDMVVRGAPLIGVTAAYGMYLAAREASAVNWKSDLEKAGQQLLSTRPTAVNLKYALDLSLERVKDSPSRDEARSRLLQQAHQLAEDEVERSRLIGEFGAGLIREIYQENCNPVNILTHCNAGWLACVDYGTATAPIYQVHGEGIPVHVWVDETRPRSQGARLTAYELGEHGVAHTVIVDNAGGHLMQNGDVDLVIVGSDRTSRRGDVVNKIGTYLKALAARDNQVPFYVALPTSSIDMQMLNGFETRIELRDEREVSHMPGWDEQLGEQKEIRIVPGFSACNNPGFDVTPARLVSGLITERGLCEATEIGIRGLMEE